MSYFICPIFICPIFIYPRFICNNLGWDKMAFWVCSFVEHAREREKEYATL